MLHDDLPSSDPGTRLDIDVTPSPGRVQVRLSGELDLSTVPLLRAAVAALPAAPALELDLAPLTFCDSQGLLVLLDTAKDARRQGRDFSVTGVQGEVEELLRISGAGPLLGRPGA